MGIIVIMYNIVKLIVNVYFSFHRIIKKKREFQYKRMSGRRVKLR